jgi:hypothetical protein
MTTQEKLRRELAYAVDYLSFGDANRARKQTSHVLAALENQSKDLARSGARPEDSAPVREPLPAREIDRGNGDSAGGRLTNGRNQSGSQDQIEESAARPGCRDDGLKPDVANSLVGVANKTQRELAKVDAGAAGSSSSTDSGVLSEEHVSQLRANHVDSWLRREATALCDSHEALPLATSSAAQTRSGMGGRTMPKKARSARREARRLEAELVATRLELEKARVAIVALQQMVRAADSANKRLSQTEMRTRLAKDGEHISVGLTVSEAMLREFRYEPDYMARMLGERLAHELKVASYHRDRVPDLFSWDGR